MLIILLLDNPHHHGANLTMVCCRPTMLMPHRHLDACLIILIDPQRAIDVSHSESPTQALAIYILLNTPSMEGNYDRPIPTTITDVNDRRLRQLLITIGTSAREWGEQSGPTNVA